MRAVDTVIGVAWIGFWIYWLVAAFDTKGTRRRSASSVPIRVAIVVVIVLSTRARVLGGAAARIHNPFVIAVGLVLVLAGLAFAVWARLYLGRNWGTPMSERMDPELVTSGPYRYVRHPIYTGIILGMLGSALAAGLDWLIVSVLLGGYFVYSATVEERTMAREFPDAYPAYKRSTKMLIPFVF